MKVLIPKLICLVLAITLFSFFSINKVIAQTITITSTTRSIFCANTTAPVDIRFTETGFTGNRTFTAQLSDNTGSFASPTVIGTATINTNTNLAGAGNIQASVNRPAGIYLIRVVQGSTVSSNTACIAVFPTPPTITAPANTCGTMFTLPTVPAVPGFNVVYSIDGGLTYSAAPSTTTPGCYRVIARYVLADACGTAPAGREAPAACLQTNFVNVVIFPATPPAPTVNPGCGPIVVTPPPAVAGFDVQYSFDDGTTWGPNTPPTAQNCEGYRIRTRYVITATCFPTEAGTSNACATSPATVRRVDTEDPTVSTPEGDDETLAACNPTAAQINAAFDAPVFADNCGTPTVTSTDVTTTEGCQRTTTRTWTATDGCGNDTEVSQAITYTVDTEDPVITCPQPITVECANEVPAANAASLTATDNCGGTIIKEHVGDQISGQTCANRYTITRTYRATDACGNSSTCTQIITVYDKTAPVVQNCPKNITVAPTTLSGTVVNYTIPTATDNCGGNVTRTQTSGKPSGATFPIGTTTNTYEFTDACGNKSTCTFTVTVTNPYCDNNPKNQKVYVCHEGRTICVSVNSLQDHFSHGDYLGRCVTNRRTQVANNNVTTSMFESLGTESLNVISTPNPTSSSFRLQVESNSTDRINIRVFDALGRVIKVITGVNKGTQITFGEDFSVGTYFAEVNQGAEHKTVKLIKLH